MKLWATLIAALALNASSVAAIRAQSEVSDSVKRDGGVVIFSLGKPIVSDNILTWRYQIRNDSAQDVWICGDMQFTGSDVYLAADNKTLMVQRRLDRPVPEDRPMGEAPTSTYIRLRNGGVRTERMSLSLPVSPRYVFSERRGDRPLEYATRLMLEIGYYEEDLPRIVLRMREEAESIPVTKPVKRSAWVHSKGPLGPPAGSLSFVTQNERVRDRSEHVLISQAIKGEKILRLEENDLSIPYLEEDRGIDLPDLTGCTRIEMKFNGSTLDFFFPHLNEQTLLNQEEQRYLQSMEAIVVKDRRVLHGLANELREVVWDRDVAISDRGLAELTCYRDDQRLTSFTATVGDGSKIVTQKGDVFNYCHVLQSLTMLTPKIQALNLRAECAANLTNLWHRCRLYRVAGYAPADKNEFWKRFKTTGQIILPEAYEGHQKTYPRVTDWCDAMLRGYRVDFQDDLAAGRVLRCPSNEEGRSSYAMNPNCQYNSPVDVVLLFETKPGWNQHGGPDLFTFDNHDPKGGLVLLNDGTVKFIRTEEELKQLRWK